ncbi:hypothetical protein LWE61_09450 [Sphingobium sufflavum]|uniref:pirin family protein n=1 Tax=Sphingobium sufflavum TaxID=1129547 RepID=UPI001F20EE91|nr:hypothetical protein [Sphingobium sufflavum]MCE7796782.1 hypothetical protein [Sphingobium sufflavum]
MPACWAQPFGRGNRIEHDLAGRRAYLVAASGRIAIDGITLGARDGAVREREERIPLTALDDTQIVLVERHGAGAIRGGRGRKAEPVAAQRFL